MNASAQNTQLNALIKISHSTLVGAMSTAMMSQQYALHLEVSCGLAVFAIANNTKAEAKRDLNKLYADAGWLCATPQQESYKTVSRRIGASAALYEYLVRTNTLSTWVGDGAEMMLIDNIVHSLQEHKLKTINGILEYAEKPVHARAATHAANEPAHTPVQEPVTSSPSELPGIQLPKHAPEGSLKRRSEDKLEGAARYEYWLNKRATVAPDASKAGHIVVGTAHIHVDIAPKATKAEIASVIVKLLAISEELNKSTLLAEKLRTALINEKEQEEHGDDIGNKLPPKSRKMLDKFGNIAAKEEFIPEVNGNVPESMKPAKRQARTFRAKAKV